MHLCIVFCRFRVRYMCATKMSLNLICNFPPNFKAVNFSKKIGTSTFQFSGGGGIALPLETITAGLSEAPDFDTEGI